MSPTPDRPTVTRLLRALTDGEIQAGEELLPLVYQELHRMAARYLRHERRDHTLQPTALVHEAYLKLVDQREVQWQGRRHFFGLAAQMMRRILVDHARRLRFVKRGGDWVRIPFDEVEPLGIERPDELVALDQALSELATIDPERARIVELRYFGGLEVQEIAELLGLSIPTVNRRWRAARAWLFHTLHPDPPSIVPGPEISRPGDPPSE